MSAQKQVKFFSFLLFVTVISASCGYWRKTETAALDVNTFTAVETKSDVPFSTKEPENFQAEIIVTAGGIESKTFIARNGANRRYDYNYGEKNAVSDVNSETDGRFLVLRGQKIYAENESKQTSDNLTDSQTTEWLNQKTDAKFTNLGAENGLTKHRVVLGDDRNSESIIYVDEKIGLPVRQEFYSLGGGGGQKVLQYTMELRNFKPEANMDLFEIPKDYRKISLEQFQINLRKGGK